MNNKKTKASREKTYNDLVEKLNKYNKCAFLRPTGFGKTWTLSKLIKEKKYKSILYFYPSEVIKDAATDGYLSLMNDEDKELVETVKKMKKIPNCEMITYAKLARMTNETIESFENKYDLVIFDECHRLGGKKTKENAKKLLNLSNNSHIVGATATPNRMDGYNVVHDMFEDITVYPYTLHDAFQDGLLLTPYYIYCTDHDMDSVRKDLKEEALMAGEDIDDIRVEYVLNSKVFEVSKLVSMDNMVKKYCNKYSKSTYLKFIVFFTNTQALEEHSSDVRDWFVKAYPNRSIRELTIISSNKILQENKDKLKELQYKENHIDLIYCINMINEGYHVDDLTGLVMYRCTHSETIYTQQFGRSLSSSSKHRCIIFDVVDNIHRKFQYEYYEPTKKKIKDSISIHTENAVEINIIHNGSAVYIDTDIDNNLDVDISNNIDINSDTDHLWYQHMNDIEEGELNLIYELASYREIIAKTVAEAMSIKCREAFACHFRKWCIYNNIPYPITDEELEKIYKVNKADFVNYFNQLIINNNLNYPMHDAQKLLDIGKDNKDGIPMEIFAKWKNVSIRAILDLLDVA